MFFRVLYLTATSYKMYRANSIRLPDEPNEALWVAVKNVPENVPIKNPNYHAKKVHILFNQ